MVAALDWEVIARASLHPTKLLILEALQVGPSSPSAIAGYFGAAHYLSLGVVSYHMRGLERMGLVKLDRVEPVRGAVCHYYRLAV